MEIWQIALICATTVGIGVVVLYVLPPGSGRAEELAVRNEAMLFNVNNGIGELMNRVASIEVQIKEIEGLPAIAKAVTRSEEGVATLTQKISDLEFEVGQIGEQLSVTHAYLSDIRSELSADDDE